LLLAAVAVIRRARREHAANDLAIAVETLRLEVRAGVGIEAQPGHAVEDHAHRLIRRALAVGVLDAQDEFPAHAARVQPAEERRTHAADVQHSGRTRSKTRDDSHRTLSGTAALGRRVLERTAAPR